MQLKVHVGSHLLTSIEALKFLAKLIDDRDAFLGGRLEEWKSFYILKQRGASSLGVLVQLNHTRRKWEKMLSSSSTHRL